MIILVKEPKAPKITITRKNVIVLKQQDDRIVVVKTDGINPNVLGFG